MAAAPADALRAAADDLREQLQHTVARRDGDGGQLDDDRLLVALRRAPLAALKEAVACATREPELYYSHARQALKASIHGLESALVASGGSCDASQSSPGVSSAGTRLHILRELLSELEAAAPGQVPISAMSPTPSTPATPDLFTFRTASASSPVPALPTFSPVPSIDTSHPADAIPASSPVPEAECMHKSVRRHSCSGPRESPPRV
eukprot:gnl/TRDRNA2_/TRDRNA2_91417_c0_seq1.p1 gnl/TRDRNA2_/TRDRNA2_91417_c0~~gnl/TRDRNA2_/TRDRNA2_91417_c0_seq1.p1  ORF type:complete len:207 (-),score=28.90 gnl/TRDRNA2_/TRDRNA2_91417_c0_seq1:146-766(-)